MLIGLDPGSMETPIAWKRGGQIEGARTANLDTAETLRHLLFSEDRAPGKPVVLIEEMRFYGSPSGKDIFESVKWSGYFWRICHEAGIEPVFVPRKTVVSALTGSVASGDPEIRAALQHAYGVDLPNAWSALALVLWYEMQQRGAA